MPDDTFTYRGHKLKYLDHSYNATRLNERAVEVPIAEAWCERVWRNLGRHGDGIEIGNVLDHYGLHPLPWPTIDLHEQGQNVHNIDVRTLALASPIDAVVSISTFEHVGQDEDRWEDAWPAIERVADMLAPDGSMLVTIGLGQNPALDEVLLTGGTSASTACTLVSEPKLYPESLRTWRYGLKLETRPYLGHSGMGAGAVWVGQFGRPVL